ncbi:FUSC family protein [Curtobacterium sp. RRHDQ66]|uniref:FUSC family protein n=1 Tax=Curtobacterium guangdongense TaxID=3413380 RepID=UPI003BF0D7D4
MGFEHIAGVGTRVWRWSRTSGTQPRLLHAGKAAFAACLAWFIARHVPGVASDYPYYAPLGAVVAMQTTVFAGLRSGIQTLVGIGLGIVIAGFTMWIGDPGFIAIALAVGIGVLVGGFRILGEGSSWVSTAALFVLLVGGAHAEGYSLGYLVQMAVGVVIGLLVNFLVFPPLRFWDAEQRIDAVNDVLADHLDGLAAVLDADERDEKAWDRQQDRLDRAIADVRSRVSIAHESRKLNPRGALRGSRARLQQDGARFRALERAAWYTTDLTELVARSGPVSDGLGRPDPAFAEPLAKAFRELACMIRGECPESAGDEAIAEVERALDASKEDPSHVAVTSAALVSLRGIVESERRATADLDTSTGPSAFGHRRDVTR